MPFQVSEILKKDEAEPTLSHQERLGYLNSAIRLARVLGERDKAINEGVEDIDVQLVHICEQPRRKKTGTKPSP